MFAWLKKLIKKEEEKVVFKDIELDQESLRIISKIPRASEIPPRISADIVQMYKDWKKAEEEYERQEDLRILKKVFKSRPGTINPYFSGFDYLECMVVEEGDRFYSKSSDRYYIWKKAADILGGLGYEAEVKIFPWESHSYNPLLDSRFRFVGVYGIEIKNLI